MPPDWLPPHRLHLVTAVLPAVVQVAATAAETVVDELCPSAGIEEPALVEGQFAHWLPYLPAVVQVAAVMM